MDGVPQFLILAGGDSASRHRQLLMDAAMEDG
jgi:hypothetical protein